MKISSETSVKFFCNTWNASHRHLFKKPPYLEMYQIGLDCPLRMVFIWILVLYPSFRTLPMSALFLLVVLSLTDGLLVLNESFSLKIRSYLEGWGPWKYGVSYPFTLTTIISIYFTKCVNCLLSVNYILYKSVSYSWYNMNWVLEFLEMTRLIQTTGSSAVLLTTIETFHHIKMILCLNLTSHRV